MMNEKLISTMLTLTDSSFHSIKFAEVNDFNMRLHVRGMATPAVQGAKTTRSQFTTDSEHSKLTRLK